MKIDYAEEKKRQVRIIRDLNPGLIMCPICKNETMRITPKKKIKFCF